MEFSRWFVLVPISISLIYGMLRVNYERFTKLKSEVEALKSEVKALRQTHNEHAFVLADVLVELRERKTIREAVEPTKSMY